MIGATKPAGLYVHVPFCAVKCFYCDFAAFSGQKAAVSRYLSAVESEAGMRPPLVPATLYVGGGTPSELSAAEIARLFTGLERSFGGRPWGETTFEANPESLTSDKLPVLREAGVTRLSLGLQTLDDGLLKSIGRRHTAADFLQVYERAREAGPWDLNVDLMYGLPGQTLEGCFASLDQALSLEPEHVSLYGLQVEDRTLFGKRGVEPDEDLGRRMFEGCLERLAQAGYRHYEISNFAKPGRESRHNLNYWRDGEYLGLGCGASSHVGGVRWSNLDRLGAYCEAVEVGRRPVAEAERLEGRRKLGERVLLGLRLIEGLELTQELREAFVAQWRRLERLRLVRRFNGRACLTREGVFLANRVFREFVAPFDDAESSAGVIHNSPRGELWITPEGGGKGSARQRAAPALRNKMREVPT